MTDTQTSPALRFGVGARARDTGVFYDERKTLASTSGVMPEAPVPPGDWLQEITLLVEVASTGNSATVALANDAPWSLFSEIAFLDAGGQVVHALSGYNLYLVNLLGGFKFQNDPTTSPFYTALTTGGGTTAGSGKFLLRIPVEIIDREGIGAYPNAASNAVTRIRLTLAPTAQVYSTAPTAAPEVRVRMISTGLVVPSDTSPAGRPFSPEPPGAGTFQQWTQLGYDLTAGRRTIPHTRKGQTYRTLLFVTRDNSGVRSDAIVSDFRFSVDDVASMRGPWGFCRHVTWERQLLAAANLPTGVVQVSFAHEFDGKVGGELRDNWVMTAPGSKVEMELEVAAAGTIQVITNEIIPAPGTGVLRV